MKRNPWLILFAIYLASIFVVMAEYKVPPVIPNLISELNLSMVAAGLSMSIFCFTAIVLAFPSAVILQKFGAKITGLAAIGFTALGSLLGLGATNFNLFLVSRIIEGIGMGLMAVLAPAVIALVFPREKRGLPMGIWASWFPFGISLIFFLAPSIVNHFGRLGLWWFTVILGIIVMVIYGLIIPGLGKETSQDQNNELEKPSIAKAVRYPAIWLLGIAFFTFNINQLGYVNWGPTYLIQTLQFDPGTANYYFSIQNIISVVGTVIAGLIIGKLFRYTQKMLLTVLILLAVVYGFAFSLTQSIALFYLAILGFLTSFVATLVWTMTPDTMPSKTYTGIAMAMMIIFQNLGDLSGPPAIGWIVQNTGNWGLASILLIAAMVISIICLVVYPKAGFKRS
ncbi:MAG TPA: MFS transporter [Peptococcaceae bacterium]|nr:MFS transporter [Peptococcaceae bacterium]